MGGSAQKADNSNPALKGLQASNAQQNDPRIQSLLSQVGSGAMSYDDAMKQAGSFSSDVADNSSMMRTTNHYGGQDFQNALSKAAYSDPRVATMLAQQSVLKDPTLSGLYGPGGVSSQAQDQNTKLNGNLDQDREALMGRDQSYGLTDTDLAAYGQASGDIARQFGQTGQNLSQMLSSQGLSSSSAPAAQMFSGAMGNQNEQLARLQTNIAQNRIQTAQGLAQARSNQDIQQQGQNSQLMLGLGNLGQNAETNAFNRNLQSNENGYNQQAGASGMAMQNQDLQQNVNNAQWAQANSFTQGLLGMGAGLVGQAAGTATTKGINKAFGS